MKNAISNQSRKNLAMTMSTSLLSVALLFPLSALAESGQLVVEISGVQDDAGTIRASLYSEPDSFRKEEHAFMRIAQPAKAGRATLVFRDVPPGRYAIMAYHDGNDDGKLNLRFGMFPTEGYALSNNPKAVGPPRFSDSTFDFTGSQSAPIPLILAY